jgi:phosphoribosylglycinamide formyltransferase-1
MTSVRELAGDEQVGRSVVDTVTGESYGYRASIIERLASRLHDASDPLAQTFELAAVVIDDRDSELAPIMRSSPPWPPGAVPRELLLRMPSSWRRLPRVPGERLDDFRVRKQAAKARYEADVCAALARRGVDVIVSDSYMGLFGATMLAAFGGRILNVHPGVLEPGHPVARVAIAGVSVHLVTDTVDGGPTLAQERWTFDPADITPERIRHENYALKYRVLSRALARWANGYRSNWSSGSRRPSGVEGQSPMRRAPILT